MSVEISMNFAIKSSVMMPFRILIIIVVTVVALFLLVFCRRSSYSFCLFRRQCLMYSTRVCSLVNLRGGWVGRGGNPPTYPPTPPPTYPPTPPPTHPQLASSSTDTFKQRENQNKEKLTKVAAYEL